MMSLFKTMPQKSAGKDGVLSQNAFRAVTAYLVGASGLFERRTTPPLLV